MPQNMSSHRKKRKREQLVLSSSESEDRYTSPNKKTKPKKSKNPVVEIYDNETDDAPMDYQYPAVSNGDDLTEDDYHQFFDQQLKLFVTQDFQVPAMFLRDHGPFENFMDKVDHKLRKYRSENLKNTYELCEKLQEGRLIHGNDIVPTGGNVIEKQRKRMLDLIAQRKKYKQIRDRMRWYESHRNNMDIKVLAARTKLQNDWDNMSNLLGKLNEALQGDTELLSELKERADNTRNERVSQNPSNDVLLSYLKGETDSIL
eukprot:TRINITY_DN9066_c0_g2_i1.p1 TRINITY_DN9066_c0_g2~~TRINITY_DN9066_c0_g2_i1.p1  ORF type:complete len:259 (-),score=51.96 TRINITY_DN9066_c0_g2_i1:43-819(-)